MAADWKDTVNLLGSVASITGISLLTLNKAFPDISLAEIVAYGSFASLTIAVLSVVWMLATVVRESLRAEPEGSLKVFALGLLVPISIALVSGLVVLLLKLTQRGLIPFYSWILGR
jgi:hypothetical protein